MKELGLPLFLLGPDIFPGFTTTLRVFEPRYKQMMDDCIMDSKPFGYISADPSKGELNGWSQPSNYGMLCYVKDYRESGTNLIIEVEATSAFVVDEVIQPVLPNLMDLERFPAVEELMEEAGNPQKGKLYLTGNVTLLEQPIVDFDEQLFLSFYHKILPASQILHMSCMYKGQDLIFYDIKEYKDVERMCEFVWKVCCALCYDVPLQESILMQASFTAIITICTDRCNLILSNIED